VGRGGTAEEVDRRGDDIDDDDDDGGGVGPNEWLLRKLTALASITQGGNDADAMLGCDAVLLARLLLEEQLLDGGRSNGRGGKYGGKFHPSTSTTDDDERPSPGGEGRGRRGRSAAVGGSRPLTVGELHANWPELRDVARIRYPFVRESSDGRWQDPLPHIRRRVREIHSSASRHWGGARGGVLPSLQSLAHDVLFDYRGVPFNGNGGGSNLRRHVMLLLGHDAHIPLTLESLSMLGYDLDVEADLEIPDVDEIMAKFVRPNASDSSSRANSTMKVIVTTSDIASKRLGRGLLLVVPDARKDETHSAMIERIVADYRDASSEARKNLCVVHSSLDVLKQCKPFLGEDA